jgi:hypothetical protein
MQRALALTTLALAACGAQVGDGSIDNQVGDAGTDAFAAPPDAPPDARPCTGGDNRGTDAAGTCFVYFAAPRTRAAAQADCAANGANLAKISNAEQNALVASLAGSGVAFLGATDAAAEGTYLWPDLTPLTFTNYRAGEPNNGGGAYQEDCLVLEAATGTWDDRPCAPPPVNSGAYPYVCQL